MSEYKQVYNELMLLARKRVRDQVTNTEWNKVVGTLATQLNIMGANLDVVHETLSCMAEITEEDIEDILNRIQELEHLTEKLGDTIVVSETEPEEEGANIIWAQIINDLE